MDTSSSGSEPVSQGYSAAQKKTLAVALISTACMVLGGSSVSPLIPALANKFQLSLTTTSWILTAYCIPGIVFAPIAGLLADRYGRKIVLLPSFFLFCLAGSACALTDNFSILLFCRFLQGIGGVAMGMLNTTILGDAFHGKGLSKVIGINLASLTVCTALYPALVGFIAHHYNLNAPFLLPAFWLIATPLIVSTPLAKTNLQAPLGRYVSEVLSSAATTRNMALFSITFFSFVLLYGPIVTCLPQLLHQSFSASPKEIGLLMMLMAFSSSLMSISFAAIIQWITLRKMLACAQLICLTALLLIPAMTSLWWLIIPIIFYGLSQGSTMPTVQAVLLQTAEPSKRASIMATNSVLMRLGQTISPTLFAFSADTFGIDNSFYAAMVIPLCMMTLSILFIPNTKTAR